jgi:hypothetical protein
MGKNRVFVVKNRIYQIEVSCREADKDDVEATAFVHSSMLVLFQGHDGVFRLKPRHPKAGRNFALLREALRQKARVWFIAQKPDLTLPDIQSAGEASNGWIHQRAAGIRIPGSQTR